MTRKTINLSRADLLRYNLFVLPRIPSYLRTFAIIWGVVLFLDWSANRALPTYEFGSEVLVSTLVTALVVFVIWYAAVLALVMAGARHNGLVGKTVYSLEDAGFRYVTESTNSITRWESISKTKIIGNMIYVELTSYVFCLLPLHQFDNEEAFESFYQEILAHLPASS